eukprot:gene5325-10649_t
MRPGSLAAKDWLVCSHVEWSVALEKYDFAIELCIKDKKRFDLKTLDKWWREDYKPLVTSRTPQYITIDELERIMQWKISRGKDRPMLLGLIKQNTPNEVQIASKKAFKLLLENDWKSSMEAFMMLKGVGPATASALLAPLDPVNCPFMADEVLECTRNKKREYTFKAYQQMREVLVERTSDKSGGWDAETLGKALWAHAIASLGSHDDPDAANTKDDDGDISTAKLSGRKRRKEDSVIWTSAFSRKVLDNITRA